jgi:hypothetical protein
MMALRRNICLLKDKNLPQMQSDLIGKLYRPFDPLNIPGTLPNELEKWMKDKGII